MKYFHVLYFLVFIIFCLVLPTMRVWKRKKILAITFKNTDSAHDYIGKLFKVIIVSAGIPAIIFCVNEDALDYLIPVILPEYFFYTGLVIMVVSLIWVIVAQLQMANSWRIGIDFENKTELVHSGLFKLSRNPIYLGMHGSLLGFFMVLPNMLSLIVFIQAHILMQIQTRLEEEYLEKIHGTEFSDFKKKVRRWI